MQYNPRMLPDFMLYPVLNRLLADQPALRARLRAHAGKGVRIHLPLTEFAARIGEDGRLVAPSAGAAVDTRIRLAPDVLLRLAAGDHDALRAAGVEGDLALANAFVALLREFDWVLALRPWLGDIGAARAAQAITDLKGWRDRAVDSVGRNLAEYAAHETPMLADRNAVRRFVAGVDDLRDAAARLEARLAWLERRR